MKQGRTRKRYPRRRPGCPRTKTRFRSRRTSTSGSPTGSERASPRRPQIPWLRRAPLGTFGPSFRVVPRCATRWDREERPCGSPAADTASCCRRSRDRPCRSRVPRAPRRRSRRSGLASDESACAPPRSFSRAGRRSFDSRPVGRSRCSKCWAPPSSRPWLTARASVRTAGTGSPQNSQPTLVETP